MSSELYFIYDSHCPWSYAALPVVEALQQAQPELQVHAWHCAHYNGSESVGFEQMKQAEQQSDVEFGQGYVRFVDSPKNSVMSANLLSWVETKQHNKLIPTLKAIQHAHFVEGNPLGIKIDFNELVHDLKLSAPNKVFKEELSKESEYILSDVQELQEFMGTTAFPALLLVQGNDATLIDHAAYLANPKRVAELIK